MSWNASSLLHRLRRKTSTGRYVPEIDGLRFAAIVSVLLYHLTMITRVFGRRIDDLHGISRVFTQLSMNGDRGVLLFFAISGMVLGLPFARHRLLGEKPVPLRAYFLRRLTRLEPPYIANLLLRLPLVIVIRKLTKLQAAMHLAISVFYADWLVYGHMPVVHPPSWSLAVEVQFYLLAPLLAIPLFHSNAWVRRTAAIASIIACSALAAHLPGEPLRSVWQLSLLRFAQFFLVGMLAADLYLSVLPRLRSSFAWDLIALPLWLAMFLMPDGFASYLLPPIFLVLLLSVFRAPMLGRFFRLPAIAVLGGMCYSIYLTHSLVLQAAAAIALRHVHSLQFWNLYIPIAIMAVPSTLVVGTVFYVLIEQPCMDRDWPTKLWAWIGRRRLSASPSS